MSASANRKRPRTLQDVQGHTHVVTTLSLIIANDLWEQHSPLFLQGSPGTGKTSLALLSARATLCPNRPPRTYDNCGKCETCMGVDTTNIMQYTCTGADADAIANLIDVARGQPLPKEGSPRYRFFILDEVSNMTNQQLSKFLEVLENTNPFNVWILVSMKPEKLDATLSNALLSRCTTFTFPPLSTEDLTSTLVNGGVDESIARAISPYCRGNAREGWRQFDTLLLRNPDATPEWIEEQLTSGATKEARVSMWGLLHRGEVRKVMDLVGKWACGNAALTSLLKKDVVEAMCTTPTPIQGRVLHMLTMGKDEDIMYILLSWVGKDVLGTTITNPVPEFYQSPTVREVVEPLVDPTSGTGAAHQGTSGAMLMPNGISQWAALRDKYSLVAG